MGAEDTNAIDALIKRYDHIETLNYAIIDEFIARINIGAVNDETRARTVEIVWTI